MSLLPGSFLQAVVVLEAEVGSGAGVTYAPVGTTFHLAVERPTSEPPPDPGMISVSIFAVTNRHVVAGHRRLWVRVDRAGGGFQRCLLQLEGYEGQSWLCHPDEVADIAVIRTSIVQLDREGMTLRWFPPSSILDTAGMTKLGVGAGQDLFILGFPLGISGSSRNYPIARTGMIARLDEEILAEKRGFLIDASIFPGNSGGPVIIRPSGEALSGRQPIRQALLIGAVREYLAYTDVAISQQTGKPRIEFTENSGLALVTPIDFALEAIRLLEERSEPEGDTPPTEIRPVVEGDSS